MGRSAGLCGNIERTNHAMNRYFFSVYFCFMLRADFRTSEVFWKVPDMKLAWVSFLSTDHWQLQQCLPWTCERHSGHDMPEPRFLSNENSLFCVPVFPLLQTAQPSIVLPMSFFTIDPQLMTLRMLTHIQQFIRQAINEIQVQVMSERCYTLQDNSCKHLTHGSSISERVSGFTDKLS
jgi:hypothetical protein